MTILHHEYGANTEMKAEDRMYRIGQSMYVHG